LLCTFSKETEDLFAKLTPARRSGTPREMAAAVAFLAGPEATYCNGALLTVDGAFSLT